MATKADVIAYIRKNYRVREHEDGGLDLVFEVDDGRSHMVLVGWNDEEGTFTEFFGVVCEWSEEAAGKAVAAGADLIFGIRKQGNRVVVCDYQLTETIDEEEIDTTLRGIAHVADEIELKVTGGDEW